MRALRGKASNLVFISKILDSISSLSEPRIANGLAFPISMRLRLFSSLDDYSGGGKFKKTGFNDLGDHRNNGNCDDDDKLLGRNGGNVSAHQSGVPPHPIPGRPLRGERQTQQFRGRNSPTDRNYRRQERNDGFRKPFGDNGSKANMKLSDDLFSFGENDEGKRDVGLGGDDEGKRASMPSIRELLNRPLKHDEAGRKEGADFLEKFKLGNVGKKEVQSDDATSTVPPQEEKMDPPEDADVIFKKMKQTGLIPNAVAMLDGLCKDGLVQEALKLFGLMREKGTMPEVVVYTAVVEGFCQAEKLDDAKRIFRKMQNNGIMPNAFSYAVLVKGLCKVRRLEDAVDFCVEMLEAGHSPNVTTFTGLVHEFCKEKGVEEARKIIGSLKQKGFYLDEKAVRDYLDKKGPTSPMVWEAIFGPKKTTQRAV